MRLHTIYLRIFVFKKFSVYKIKINTIHYEILALFKTVNKMFPSLYIRVEQYH